MSESAIQRIIAHKLRKAGYLVTTMSAPVGWPDIRAFGGMRTILIEVKRKGKKPSELQEVMMEKFFNLGYEVYLMDDTKEIDDVINMSINDVLKLRK
jgi:Holliday junction resolvase